MLLTICWWFWRKICRKTTRGARHGNATRALQNIEQLEGQKYLGLDLDWYYDNRTVYLLMLWYVVEALTILRHKQPCKPQDQLYLHINPNYGVKVQYDEATDNSPPLSKEHKKVVHEVTVNLLYYARSVDPTVLILLGSIAAEQAKHTDQTMQKVKQLLDHAASHLDYVSV